MKTKNGNKDAQMEINGDDIMIYGYTDLELIQSGPEKIKCAAHFKLTESVTHLFPYINTKIESSLFYENPEYIKFFFKKYICYIHPDKATAGPFDSLDEANTVVIELMDTLMDIDLKKNEIKPDFKKHKPVPVMDIFKVLPGTNCRDCKFSTCIAFAASVSIGDSETYNCPHIVNPIEEKIVYPVFNDKGEIIKKVKIDTNSAKLLQEIKKQKKYIKKLEKINPDSSKKSKAQIIDRYMGDLTPREIEVLKYVAEGFTNNNISNELSISPHTVKSHVIHIFNKLGVNDRTQAAVWAARNKVV